MCFLCRMANQICDERLTAFPRYIFQSSLAYRDIGAGLVTHWNKNYSMMFQHSYFTIRHLTVRIPRRCEKNGKLCVNFRERVAAGLRSPDSMQKIKGACSSRLSRRVHSSFLQFSLYVLILVLLQRFLLTRAGSRIFFWGGQFIGVIHQQKLSSSGNSHGRLHVLNL